MNGDGGIAATLVEIARDVATLQSPDLLLTSIARRARRQLGTDIAYLSLNDPVTAETYIRATDGVRTTAYAGIRMPLGTGVLGLAAGGVIAETPDYLPDEGKTHLPEIDQTVQTEGVRAIVGAPLRVAGRIVGALMAANRAPGAFSASQRSHLEQIASLAAAAVDLVQAKQNEAESLLLAREASEERDRIQRTSLTHRELEERLSEDLAEHGGLRDVVATAAALLGADVIVRDASGDDIVASTEWETVGAKIDQDAQTIEASPLIGDAGPGSVILRGGVNPEAMAASAPVIARYVSVALLYDRTVEDIRRFSENELVGSLLAPADAGGRDLSSRIIRRTLGGDGRVQIVVLLPVRADEITKRRVLSHARTSVTPGRALVGVYLGRIVVITRTPITSVDEWRGMRGLELCYAGFTTAVDIDHLPGAYSEAAAISSAMRALQRPGVIATAADAGIAGLVLSGHDHATTQRYLAAYLGPLLTTPRGESLLETAHEYLDANCSMKQASARLHVHPNTVRQRIEKIDQLLGGTAWRTGAIRLETHLAVRFWRLQTHKDVPDRRA